MPDDVRITVGQLRQRMKSGENFTFVDSRNPQAWAQSKEKLPGALRIAADAGDESLLNIPKDKPVVVYCT